MIGKIYINLVSESTSNLPGSPIFMPSARNMKMYASDGTAIINTM